MQKRLDRERRLCYTFNCYIVKAIGFNAKAEQAKGRMTVRRTNAVKMKDVAERAGVSTMTVSLALGGSPRITPETRQRVLDVVKELQYSPNARARALRSGFTNIIGLYAGFGSVNVRLPFFTEVVSGLQEGCEQVKKDLLLHGVFHGGAAADIFTELADGRIDGLVVNMPQDNPLAARLAESGFPVVAIADPLVSIPSVLVDDAEGSRLLAEHLHQQGHRRLAYLSSQARPLSAMRRRDAFLHVAARLGMDVEENGFEGRPGQNNPFVPNLAARDPASRPPLSPAGTTRPPMKCSPTAAVTVSAFPMILPSRASTGLPPPTKTESL